MAAPRVRVVAAAEPLPDSIRLSIIIPVLNEADRLGICLESVLSRPWARDSAEIIVCDGGSSDATAEVARGYPCKLLSSPAGRATQMNRGAEAARGDYLLFMHVDSHLPDDFEGSFPAGTEWGFFRLRLDDRSRIYRVIESSINIRTRLTYAAGGDQGLFFSRSLFDRIGGFPPIPLMEDLAICKRARQIGKPHIVESRLTSSSRRWQQNGVVKTILLMWSLRLAYLLGADPRRLHRIYYPPQS